ncbi:Ppx/GppA family phosphatase [Plantactinospora sp. S1510]|uniref:Ppx/GppA family phosphatase n=1 Tax=Plantactinospora alkalitolerans TaxID=2789879 RepID=A0ABS0GU89_9ACTN|nr:Ppx/GppA phosphatase family protein [Plantactinospora alkalitolerans]MBF9129782.1 Ppx/GppA family phosphatase [Plantactinospora alkalitolerans]
MTETVSERVAAIDCGTNSIRLLVADLPDPSAGPEAELADVVRRMEIVRLGQGIDRTGRLAPEAIERTRLALVGYATEIESLGVSKVRMCATSASRDASNADEFRAMVLDTLGVEPEVVTGDEEARLSFTGAVRGLDAEVREPYLVVDIGGGSTEFVVGRRPATGGTAQVDAAVSVDIGCVRMTERHLSGDPPTAEQVAAAEADITAVVDRALSMVPGREAATLIGLAGSVTTVVGIAQGLPEYRSDRIHHARVSYADVVKVTTDLLARSAAERLTIPVMHPGRADVIGAGALVLQVIMRRAGMSSVIASEHDILDGIAYSLLPA